MKKLVIALLIGIAGVSSFNAIAQNLAEQDNEDLLQLQQLAPENSATNAKVPVTTPETPTPPVSTLTTEPDVTPPVSQPEGALTSSPLALADPSDPASTNFPVPPPPNSTSLNTVRSLGGGSSLGVSSPTTTSSSTVSSFFGAAPAGGTSTVPSNAPPLATTTTTTRATTNNRATAATNDSEQRLQQLLSQQNQTRQDLFGGGSQSGGGIGPTGGTARGGGARVYSRTEINEEAFQRVKRNALPLTPSQIVRFHESYDNVEYAKATSPLAPPTPVATSQYVSLAPGTTPPVIRLSQGFVSSLVFLDSTGAPWPVIAYDLGNPQAFNIQWDKESNTLMIQAIRRYTYGNLAVRLKNLTTPVMLTLIPGQRAVDYRVDLRIQGYGPNAKMPSFENGLPSPANPILLSVLDGVPPPGSIELRVIGGEAQAWLQGNSLFLRTRFNLLSPGWVATMSSADGMRVYELQKAPIILVSWHGKVEQLKIEGL